ncbi:hypothetical protein PL263_10185 [Methylomonas sp. EFPC3]|uniref:hypothetical protein n=1 Tax=Methylomonas sp. EFPC3 TaxID=3021710 RepID=UPI002416B01E|nr:hypothetical protein [Methylomonas sp. EFPC3]WFP48483.1 hypothetical protein PL263_10185 [Methylomonas sp. EFPC3]
MRSILLAACALIGLAVWVNSSYSVSEPKSEYEIILEQDRENIFTNCVAFKEAKAVQLPKPKVTPNAGSSFINNQTEGPFIDVPLGSGMAGTCQLEADRRRAVLEKLINK